MSQNIPEELKACPVLCVTCRSLSPMLQDHFNQISAREGQVSEKARIERLPRRERAATTIYKGPNGELGFPFEMLSSAMSRAKREQARQGIPSAILGLVYRPFIPFDPGTLHPDKADLKDSKDDIREGWLPDVRPTRTGRVTRAKFPTWGFTVQCYVQGTEETDIQAVRELFNLAGLTYGLGAYRPSKGGPFGTFAVASIETLRK